MVDWVTVGTSAAISLIATGLLGPSVKAYYDRLHFRWTGEQTLSDRQANAIDSLRRDLVELHRHFNENDTVLSQAISHVDTTGDILSAMNVAKLGVPSLPITLLPDHVLSLPPDLRQRLLFYRRLLPNVDFEIDEAAAAARGRDYAESVRLLGLLYRKDQFLLRTTVELFLVLKDAIPHNAQATDDLISAGTREIESLYHRPIDKVTPKDLYYYNTDQPGSGSGRPSKA